MTSERFARHKFLALPVSQQHKKCCELLRRIYEMPWQEDSEDISHYNDIQQWLGLSSLSFCANRKALADRFHWHLRQTTNGLKEHRLLPTISYLDKPTGAEPLPIAIYLDHIRSAHNVGSIMRTVEAMRLGTLFFSDDMVFADHKQVKDAAMGSETWVQCSRGVSLSSLPKPVICLETSSDAISIYDFIFPAQCTLIVGNEEYGCSDEALTLADHVLQIPMHGRKNSLNVANAFAITAAEIRRQHQFNQIIVR